MNKDTGHNIGLGILLTVVSTIVIIGLIVTIFTIMGGEIRGATIDELSGSNTNETIALTNDTGTALAVTGLGEDLTLSNIEVGICR